MVKRGNTINAFYSKRRGRGHTRAVNMEIIDVNKVLMSVAKICDAGNIVMF